MNSHAVANLIQAMGSVAPAPKTLYLEFAGGATAVDINSDIWARTPGGTPEAGLRIAEGDTVHCIGSQCRLRVSSDSPRFVLHHNDWEDSTGSYGRLYIDDDVTLSLGDGTDAIVDDGSSAMYIQNVGEDSNVGSGSELHLYGNADQGGGASVVQNISYKKLGGTPGVQVTYLCDYISPEGDPATECTVVAESDVVVDYSLKNHAIGNSLHSTRFTVEANAEFTGSNAILADTPVGKVLSIDGAGRWATRINLNNSKVGGRLDVSGHTGVFDPSVVEIAGSDPSFFCRADQAFDDTQFVLKSPVTLEEVLQCKTVSFSSDGQLICNGHTLRFVAAANNTILTGSTSREQAIINTAANPVRITSTTGTRTLSVRGTKARGGGSATDGLRYYGHLSLDDGSTLYLRDDNPSFESLAVTGTLRVTAGRIPTFDGDLTMLNGSNFFGGTSDWTGEGFSAETIVMQGGQVLRNAVVTLDTAGSATADCEFEGCDFSGGAVLNAVGATDSGGNSNIAFS